MWISGKPGAGKSTLMKYAFTNFKRGLGTSDAVAAFFFNARGDKLEKSTEGMYRSLLFQLLVKFPDLQEIFDDLDFMYSDQYSCPSLEDLQELIRRALSRLRRRSFTFFVDALDECDEQEVRDMVQYFEVLGEQAVADNARLWICFSSRHYPHISIRCSLRWNLEEQEGHKADLSEYVRRCLKADQYPLATEVRETILQKAAGVFMWVILVVDILNKEIDRGRIFVIKERLQECPGRLSDLFREILKRDQDNMDDLRLCIQWILYASSPLTPNEFYFAILSGLSRKSLLEGASSELTAVIMDRFVISASKGLAEITKSEHQTVQFIHESVRDFLLKDKGFEDLWPEHGDDFEMFSHERLKQCCVEYMGLDIPQCIPTDMPIPGIKDAVESLRAEALQKFPFLRYSVRNVLYHADSAATGISQNEFLTDFAFCRWIQLDNLFQRYKVRRYTNNASQLYVFADRGLSNLFRMKFDQNSDVWTEVPTERFRLPLLAAVANGHKQVVRILLKDMDPPFEQSDINVLTWGKTPVPKGQTALALAVRERYEKLAEILIKKGADVNVVDHQGLTVLWWAVDQRLDSTVKLLVEKGADVSSIHGPCVRTCLIDGNEAMVRALISTGICTVNSLKDSYSAPLHLASKHGEGAVVQLLVDHGAQVDAQDSAGNTPLHKACEHGSKAAAQLLVNNGAQIDRRDFNSSTPLHKACQGGYKDIAQLLVDNGAQSSLQDLFGYAPLHHACEGGHEAIVKMLLDHGAQVSPQDSVGYVPLHNACEGGHEAIVQMLLDHGAQVSPQDSRNKTPLHQACLGNHEGTVKLLVSYGAHISPQDSVGYTPLHWTCETGCEAVTRMLIANKAETSLRDCDGKTPLHWACRNGHEAIVRMLLDNNAQVNLQDSAGSTPLHHACKGGHETIVEALILRGAEVNAQNKSGDTPLLKASESRDYYPIIRLLIVNGANACSRNNSGDTILKKACEDHNYAVAHLLVENGTYPSSQNEFRHMPLWMACADRNEVMVQLLVDSGTHIDNPRDRIGNTPLHISCQQGDMAIVKILVDNGAQLGSRNLAGNTPLHEAAKSGCEAIVPFLVSKGAEISPQNDSGETPVQEARKNGHEAIVCFLVDHGTLVNTVTVDGITLLHEVA